MALLAFEGFDNKNPGRLTVSSSEGNPYQKVGRTGTGWAYTAGSYSTGVGSVAYTLAAPAAKVALGAALYLEGSAADDPGGQFMRLREGATVHVAIRSNSAGRIELINGNGTILGATAAVFSTTVWQHYVLTATIGDAGAATLEINGETVIDVAGVDTRNGGTTGLVDSAMITATVTGSFNYVHVDDVYVCDGDGLEPYNGSLGDCKVETLRPNGNGAANQWVGSDGNQVDNWQLVDDDNTTTDYVATATVGNRDLYTLTDPTGVDLGSVLGVQVSVLAAKSDSGSAPGSLNLITRDTAGVEDVTLLAGPAQLATGYAWSHSPVMTEAVDGSTWSVGELTDLQVGVEIGAS